MTGNTWLAMKTPPPEESMEIGLVKKASKSPIWHEFPIISDDAIEFGLYGTLKIYNMS